MAGWPGTPQFPGWQLAAIRSIFIRCQARNKNGINRLPATQIPVDDLSFEHLVDSYYESLYRFALSLTRREADACDMTQQTFYRWATKGGQLRDKSKVKSWLFTTLHREFLANRRHEVRFLHTEISGVDESD